LTNEQLDLAGAFDASAKTPELAVRDLMSLRRIGIVKKPGGQLLGLSGEHWRDGVEQLVSSRSGRHPKAEAVSDLRLADQEQ
jgi:hypothetical protein